MAIYGKGQMLGSGINPESFKQDYSGFTRAAEIQAQGIANLGNKIAGSIENYGEMKKQQQLDERAVQKSKNVAKAIGDLIPDLKPTLQNSLTILDDKELPLSQRRAEADAISDILNLGIGEIRNRSSVDLEKQKIGIDKAYREAQLAEAKRAANKPLTLEPVLEKIGDGYLSYKKGSDGNNYDETGNIITNMNAFIQGQPLEVYSTGRKNVAPNVIDAGLNMSTFGPAGDVPIVYNANGEPMLLPPPVETSETPNPLIPLSPAAVEYAATLNAGQTAQTNASRVPITSPPVNEPPASIALPPQLKSRIIPSVETNTTETFRPATEEESKPFGGVRGQVSNLTGRFYPDKPSSAELKLKYLEEAAAAYDAGDKKKALRFATAAGVGGLFGNLTISDLDDYFMGGIQLPSPSNPAAPQESPNQGVNPQPAPQAAPATRTPLGDIFKTPK